MPDDEDQDEASAPTLALPEGARVTNLGPDLAVIDFPVPGAILPAALTNAEQEVALLVFEGATDEQIAARRGASIKTVGNQLGSIFRKLGISSRAELVLRLRRAPVAGD